MSAVHELFVTCLPGLEPLLAAELHRIDPRVSYKQQIGGVRCKGDTRLVMRFNLESGLGTRVLIRLASWRVTRLSELHRYACEVAWGRFLPAHSAVQVRAVCRKSRLYHSDAVAERIAEAVAASIGAPAQEAPVIPILVRLDHDRCVVSLDTSGEPLHRRGWRLQSAKAPLREDLARAVLLVSGWRPGESLIDPMMGSGTVVIEAATMERNLAPGRLRTFAFELTALHDPELWADVRAKRAAQRTSPDTSPDGIPYAIFGRDRAVGSLRAAQANAERAGVQGDIVFELTDLRDVSFPPIANGAVVCNPPYGKRIKGHAGAIRALDARLGEVIPGIKVGVVAAAGQGMVSLRSATLTSALMTDHGATKIVLLRGETGV